MASKIETLELDTLFFGIFRVFFVTGPILQKHLENPIYHLRYRLWYQMLGIWIHVILIYNLVE